MKTIILLIGILLTCLNTILGTLLINYQLFNAIIISMVIICNTILFYSLWISRARDAYKISLSFLFILIGIIELICGSLMPFQLKDNRYIAVIAIAIVFEVLLFMITLVLSKTIKSHH